MDAVQFSRIIAPAQLGPQKGPVGEAQGSFADLLREGVDRLDKLEAEAKDLSRRLLAGEPVELHRVVIAGEEAGLAFELLTAVRNKAVDAYQEIMRTQV